MRPSLPNPTPIAPKARRQNVLRSRTRPVRFARAALAGAILLALAAGAAPTTQPSPPPMPRPRLGFALNCHHIGNLALYLESVDRIAELGANALLIVTPMFQQRVDSNAIEFLPSRCPTDDQLLAILNRASERGLRTTLLPIVLIAEPDITDWRGVLRPTDWDAWWASYRRFLDRYINLANAARVDVLSIGSELNSTEEHSDQWRQIARTTRERFAGRITYTANWDRYAQVPFWDLVDEMSVSAYFELWITEPRGRATSGARPPFAKSPESREPVRSKPADPGDAFADKRRPTPSLNAMVAAWSIERDKLIAFARKIRRPLVLTELGYPALPWAGSTLWNYTAPPEIPADGEAQARAYQAFFDAWRGMLRRSADPMLGFYCYHWDPYHRGGPNDTGYGVDGKPALEVIREAFAQLRDSAAPPG